MHLYCTPFPFSPPPRDARPSIALFPGTAMLIAITSTNAHLLTRKAARILPGRIPFLHRQPPKAHLRAPHHTLAPTTAPSPDARADPRHQGPMCSGHPRSLTRPRPGHLLSCGGAAAACGRGRAGRVWGRLLHEALSIRHGRGRSSPLVSRARSPARPRHVITAKWKTRKAWVS